MAVRGVNVASHEEKKKETVCPARGAPLLINSALTVVVSSGDRFVAAIDSVDVTVPVGVGVFILFSDPPLLLQPVTAKQLNKKTAIILDTFI